MRRTVNASNSNTLSLHQIQASEYRCLNHAEASDLLPVIRKITGRAVLALAPLQKKLNYRVPADPRNPETRRAYEAVVTQWTGKMERMGLKVLGLWQIGFDSGQGWYGWQHPESSIRYFLEYGDVFRDRNLIPAEHKYL